ncbi:antitoxin Xre/MbcA/ParS toxin-binding domain-containing protein [Pseudomonas sp. G.S.17]|uniref:antitoxin Xre/MbcA/ParS toxin-binding domain-containing protein n=1 Tax=Pseudomonas sp. G.S.17 TaxID=3137451 RepID=UPI00311C8E7B
MVAGRLENLGPGSGPEKVGLDPSGLIDGSPAGILLGGCASFADRVAIYELIERGISAADVREYASAVALLRDDRILSQITGLSFRSLRRLSSEGQNLNRDQTARVLRFAQTLDKATRVFAGPKDAEDWMSTPAVGLNWATPLRMLINPVGFELVDDFLTRMEWGVYH